MRNIMVPQVLSASPLSLARRVPLTEIHSVQLTVVQLLEHFATHLETSTRALFEGVSIAQVIIYELVKIIKDWSSAFTGGIVCMRCEWKFPFP